ncbi:sulfotransferase [Vibrio parahaemolyticus]|nr:sulfotransferase [Vibrio parahaemolyticus]HCG5273793.1 sulfotransferase [Vibrio parahaemolyticus]HCG5507991.1 sulfotransferase [Vibrio parahaemolyticus]
MKRIGLFSVPRSGSSWLGELINSSPDVCYLFQPLFSYAFKSYLDSTSKKDDVIDFFNKIKSTKDEFVLQSSSRASGSKPHFKEKEECPNNIVFKEVRYLNLIENLLFEDDEIKIVGLVRNPLSVLNSWKNAPREFRIDLGWNFKDEWFDAKSKNQTKDEEYFGYKKWKESTLLFESLAKTYPDRFIIVNYENLVNDTLGEVTRLYNFLDIDISSQTLDFINASTSLTTKETYSVFNGKLKSDPLLDIPQSIVDFIVSDCNESNLDKYLM